MEDSEIEHPVRGANLAERDATSYGLPGLLNFGLQAQIEQSFSATAMVLPLDLDEVPWGCVDLNVMGRAHRPAEWW